MQRPRFIEPSERSISISRMFSSTRRLTMSKTDERGKVTYDVNDHSTLIFQMYGSVWKDVLPYCIINTLLALVVEFFRRRDIYDMTFSDKGHSFMSIMVAFLLVTRSNIAYQRWTESRKLLSDVMRSCRELIQHMATYTRYETAPPAKKWRAEISRRTVAILRTIVSVLQFDSRGQHIWQVSEIPTIERKALLSVGGSNERSPLVLTIFLRTAIATHIEHLNTPLDVNQELELLRNTGEFITAYHNLMKLSTTPYPFPYIQMNRTFLFVWVFTLPFAIGNDISSYVPLLGILFFITYGFLGLEFVSIEMDDPFGDDLNDFDVEGLAEVVFEDIYIVIHDIDGKEAARELKETVEKPLQEEATKSGSIVKSELLKAIEKQGKVSKEEEEEEEDLEMILLGL